jgi:16S rRNA (cytidine1402-2'-O)-methyltransferase
MQKGILYLIPVPLDNKKPEESIPVSTLAIIRSLKVFIVEDIRSARRFLRSAGYQGDFSEISFYILNEHSKSLEIPEMLKPLNAGSNTGLLSEAGAPCVADPGASVVAAAHQIHIRVVPLHGPSSILLALMASGFNGQQFAFHGYLPVKDPERINKIKELESEAIRKEQTQIFIEAPYRNLQLLNSILKACNGSTMLSIACNIGNNDEKITTMPVSWWRNAQADIHKKPAVFLLSRE